MNPQIPITNLSDIVVLVGVILVPLHVISIYQRLDPLLEVGRLDGELELVVELGQQQVVAQSLPHLHDPHDGGVDLVLAVLEHPLLGRLLLVIRLFQLNLRTKHVKFYKLFRIIRCFTWLIFILNRALVKSLL